MSTRRRLSLIIGTIGLIIGAGASLYFYTMRSVKPAGLRPYFTYGQGDITRLKSLKPTGRMLAEDAQGWDEQAFEFVQGHELGDVDASKLYAYLAVAQLDAAALSYEAHGAPAGDFAAVSKEVICALYKDKCNEITIEGTDEYSEALADIVVARVKARIVEDAKGTKPSQLKPGPLLWNNPPPQIGLTAASSKPWLVKSSDQFRVSPPPKQDSEKMREQLAFVKKTLAAATVEQKAIVVQWAGGPGTSTPPGQWLDLTGLYMLDKKVSLETFLETRAVLTMTIADAVSSVFDSKYAHQYRRPNMVDTSIVTIMPTPNHPSYPAGHATISWAAATVLDHYLPANQAEWDRMAKEATDSRTFGGIHFPIDNDAGTTLGKHVANEALRNR